MKKKCHLLVWEPRNWGLLVAWKDGETEKKGLTSLESVWKKKIVPKTEKWLSETKFSFLFAFTFSYTLWFLLVDPHLHNWGRTWTHKVSNKQYM